MNPSFSINKIVNNMDTQISPPTSPDKKQIEQLKLTREINKLSISLRPMAILDHSLSQEEKEIKKLTKTKKRSIETVTGDVAEPMRKKTRFEAAVFQDAKRPAVARVLNFNMKPSNNNNSSTE